MVDWSEPQIREVFAAETRRLVARRVPLAVACFVGWVTVAGLVELTYDPGRLTPLVVTLSVEMLLCAAAIVASRALPAHVILTNLAAALGIGICITAYVVWAGASGDALAFGLIVFLTGVALLYPWGARGQVPLVVGIFGAYLLALAAGVRGELPLPYGILAMGGGAATSIVGAVFLDLLRRSILHQRTLLERARDHQMAMLNEVSRTVTATLELPLVLRHVCLSVLDALGLDRLWLFWREALGGEVSALGARRTAGRVEVTELAGAPARWEPLLRADGHLGPALREPNAEEAEGLRPDGPLPARLLRLPLAFQSELVGVVLADAGADRLESRPTFLDFAATLGNGAAMAIGNARLHALVLQHRGELQRLSKEGLAVVEEVMRRISRELHDGTCQALTAIKMDLGRLERQLGGEAGTLRQLVRDIRAQVLQVMQGVREMSHLIHPPVLDDFGAVAAMESVAAKYRSAADLDVRVECPDPTMRLDPALELVLFRLFQEALTNVARHAAATRVDVRLSLEDRRVRLEILDDGRGFDANAYFRSPPPSAGVGLLGMRERVAHFGGSFHVTSRPGRGTRILATVPVEPRRTAEVAATV